MSKLYRRSIFPYLLFLPLLPPLPPRRAPAHRRRAAAPFRPACPMPTFCLPRLPSFQFYMSMYIYKHGSGKNLCMVHIFILQHIFYIFFCVLARAAGHLPPRASSCRSPMSKQTVISGRTENGARRLLPRARAAALRRAGSRLLLSSAWRAVAGALPSSSRKPPGMSEQAFVPRWKEEGVYPRRRRHLLRASPPSMRSLLSSRFRARTCAAPPAAAAPLLSGATATSSGRRENLGAGGLPAPSHARLAPGS